MRRLIIVCSAAIWVFLSGNILAGSAGVPKSNAASPAAPKFEFVPAPPEVQQMMAPKHAPLHYVPKKPGHYSPQDWRAAIDATWGPGFDPGQSYVVWQQWWNLIDQNYAAFQGLSPNVWDSIYAKYNPELLDFDHPVSKGRFDAILEHASLALKDEHTRAFDTVCDGTAMLPGVPLMHMVYQFDDGHFGAGLTALPDSSAMVVRVVPDHPLGLQPGDIILGYDRIPWLQLVQELMDAELPIRGISASSDRAILHYQIMSAGMNWHLYDTIDIEKYGTHDTLHLPTSLLAGQNMQIWATEQLDIPGVNRPNFLGEQIVSWGIIEGTSIGYIYINGYFYNCAAEWYDAIYNLLNNYQTTGLIIDSRFNFGGGNSFSDTAGTNLLFDTFTETYCWRYRCSGGDHFTMCRPTTILGGAYPYDDSVFAAHGNGGYYKPIAILTGPVSISHGDMKILKLARHPMAKVFGKPTCGAFGNVARGYLYTGIKESFCSGNSYEYDTPGEYLVHKGFPDPRYFPDYPFEEVWLTRDGVAQGRDDVVEAAKAWILSRDLDQDGILNENDNCPNNYNPLQEDADHDGRGDSCCCMALTGNVDGDAGDVVDISDLSAMVDYLFASGTISACAKENDVDKSGSVDISDLQSLIDFLFNSVALPSCP